jgi:hypothetical protein
MPGIYAKCNTTNGLRGFSGGLSEIEFRFLALDG